MIVTRSDLKEYIDYEKSLYYGGDKGSMLHAFLVGSKFYKIQRYLRILRISEYHKNNQGLWHKMLFAFCHRKKHLMGAKLGFEIPENCVGKGLMIYHIAPIVINEEATMGENCMIAGNFCLGHKEKGQGAPKLGNNIYAGWGSCVIGNVKVADGVVLGANATLLSDVEKENTNVAGTPARVVSPKAER